VKAAADAPVGEGAEETGREEDARSEASEWEPRERRKRGEERRHEAEELGAEVEERPLFFPTPSFIDYTEDE
jgi:hypothetical protein